LVKNQPIWLKGWPSRLISTSIGQHHNTLPASTTRSSHG
jgi:hypothetical protein